MSENSGDQNRSPQQRQVAEVKNIYRHTVKNRTQMSQIYRQMNQKRLQ